MMLGTWTLEEWSRRRGEEIEAFPHGETGEGRLQVSPQGSWSLFLQTRDWREADAGVRPAPDRFLALCGDWRPAPGGAVLVVVFCSDARWRDAELSCQTALVKRRLVMRFSEPIDRTRRPLGDRLVWRRA